MTLSSMQIISEINKEYNFTTLSISVTICVIHIGDRGKINISNKSFFVLIVLIFGDYYIVSKKILPTKSLSYSSRCYSRNHKYPHNVFS